MCLGFQRDNSLDIFDDEIIGFSDVNKTIALEEFVEYLNIALEDDIEIKTDKAPVPLFLNFHLKF